MPIKRPAYGELSGEVAHRFLHAQDFVDVLLPQRHGGVVIGMDDKKRAMLAAICARMHTIDGMVLRASPMCDHEVDELQVQTDAMAKQWHDYFIGEALTPKQHMLFVDVPRFARQHRMVYTHILIHTYTHTYRVVIDRNDE